MTPVNSGAKTTSLQKETRAGLGAPSRRDRRGPRELSHEALWFSPPLPSLPPPYTQPSTWHGLASLHAQGATFCFLNKSFLVTKHLVDIIFQSTKSFVILGWKGIIFRHQMLRS